MTTPSEHEQEIRKPGRPRSAQAHKAILDATLEQLVVKIIGEQQTNPEIFQVFITQLLVPRFQQFRHMVEQAQARNEIRRDIDPTLVIDLVSGSLYFHWIITRFLVPSSSFADEWVEQMIDAVIQGIKKK